MAAGLVVLWSGETPRHVALPIPEPTLELGRDQLDPDDIEISRRHCRIVRHARGLELVDFGGRNGTIVNGELVHGRAIDLPYPSILRIGRTLCLAVRDLAPCSPGLRRFGEVTVGGSLAASCQQIDVVALAEEHLALLGPLAVGRGLAHAYSQRVGGALLEVVLDPFTTTPMPNAIDPSVSPRTLSLVLDRPLTDPDRAELDAWLETDVRIVSSARDMDAFKYLDKELRRRLVPNAIELPAVRLDELPTTFAEVIAKHPTLRPHASLIEVLLLQITEGEERVLKWLASACVDWVDRGMTLIKGRDFESYRALDAALHNCYAG